MSINVQSFIITIKIRYNKARANSTVRTSWRYGVKAIIFRLVYSQITGPKSLSWVPNERCTRVFPLIPHDLNWVQCYRHLLSRQERREFHPQLFQPDPLILSQEPKLDNKTTSHCTIHLLEYLHQNTPYRICMHKK